MPKVQVLDFLKEHFGRNDEKIATKTMVELIRESFFFWHTILTIGKVLTDNTRVQSTEYVNSKETGKILSVITITNIYSTRNIF